VAKLSRAFTPLKSHEYDTISCLCGYRYTIDITATNKKYETVVVEGDEEFEELSFESPGSLEDVLVCPKCGTLKMEKE
jgi:transcriptional antiterminator Rof (Rho-off)